ncbi:MAG: hypothetical protein MSS60_10420 [Clostridiales bacterium]|nr:hypothetical protein [Clostridiales bacterium]
MMDAKIQIHDDYCSNMSSEDIQAVLSQVTALITGAILRAGAQPEEPETAA